MLIGSHCYWLVPMLVGSHTGWFPLLLVVIGSHTNWFAYWFPYCLVPILVAMLVGFHAGWFPCWLVPILVGSHTGWFPYCTTYKIFVIRDIGIPPFLRDYIIFFNKIRSSHTSYCPLKCRCHESQRFSMTCWLVPIRAGLNILIVILNGRRT